MAGIKSPALRTHLSLLFRFSWTKQQSLGRLVIFKDGPDRASAVAALLVAGRGTGHQVDKEEAEEGKEQLLLQSQAHNRSSGSSAVMEKSSFPSLTAERERQSQFLSTPLSLLQICLGNLRQEEPGGELCPVPAIRLTAPPGQIRSRSDHLRFAHKQLVNVSIHDMLEAPTTPSMTGPELLSSVLLRAFGPSAL